MAAQGTVHIYYRTTENHRHPVEGVHGFWYVTYAYLAGESVTVRLQPSVLFAASEKQLLYHADQALKENCRRTGEPYTPTTYHIEGR